MSKRRQRADVQLTPKALILLGIMGIALMVGAVVAYQVRKEWLAGRGLARAQQAVRDENWALASKNFRQYLWHCPDDLAILRQFAEVNQRVRPVSDLHLAWAIGAYRRILRHEPQDGDLWIRVAKLYLMLEDYNEATYVCRRQLERDPNDVAAALLLGETLGRQGRTEEAIRGLERLVGRRPDCVDAYLAVSRLVGRSETRLSQYGSREWIDRAVEATGSARALLHRAEYCRLVEPDTAAARRDLEAAEKLPLGDPRDVLSLAREWMELNELERARAALDRLAPDAASSTGDPFELEEIARQRFLVAARLALRRGDVADAAAEADCMRHRVSLTLQKPCLLLAVAVYATADRLDDARACLSDYESIRDDEDEREEGEPGRLGVARATLALAEGRAYDAINQLMPLVAVSRHDPAVWKMLARACRRTGQGTRYLHAMEEYAKRVPNDCAVLRGLAAVYLTAGDRSRGLWAARQAEADCVAEAGGTILRLEAELADSPAAPAVNAVSSRIREEALVIARADPTNAAVQVLLAKIAARRGESEEAMARLQRAVELSPLECTPRMRLADYCRLQGRLDEARLYGEQAVRCRPDVAAPRILLAGIVHQAEGMNAARRLLEEAIAELEGEQRLRARVTMARLLVRSGAESEAAAQLQAALTESPGSVAALEGLLALPSVMAEPGQGQALVDRLRHVEGEYGPRWRVARARLWLRDPDWAARREPIEDLILRVIEYDPAWSQPVLLLGDMYAALDEDIMAEATYLRAFDTYPGMRRAGLRLIALYERRGRTKDAESIRARLEEAGPDVFDWPAAMSFDHEVEPWSVPGAWKRLAFSGGDGEGSTAGFHDD